MKVSAQQLRVDTTAKTAQLQGYEGGSRKFLKTLAADLIKADGTIKGGYLKLGLYADVGEDYTSAHLQFGSGWKF